MGAALRFNPRYHLQIPHRASTFYNLVYNSTFDSTVQTSLTWYVYNLHRRIIEFTWSNLLRICKIVNVTSVFIFHVYWHFSCNLCKVTVVRSRNRSIRMICNSKFVNYQTWNNQLIDRRIHYEYDSSRTTVHKCVAEWYLVPLNG